ncbi:Bug family tripartite tricarboxylate transporter substrate binding protein [Sabulicella glaciei]|uniref:Tripartite tricarboxylate transporter substrate binding protein n=1 Tax=Sabulicella glaciei TaxID=2984948 RepID=A0ABT3P1D2_9PROT|nr:tripartite tricarboxylate transporter substrate binding protein [Roseococcus sp. MDT2-1-1]MCW8087564.1 tripartite tricarboxylate transporter substrate binding protein [Roseococcus sp. MDT2-1-1]
MRRPAVAFAAFFSVVLSWGDPLPAGAQSVGGPADRPITFVVPFPPGGATDVLARLIAGPLGEAMGAPVVVENRAGAGGSVGAAAVARAAPDGRTLLMGTIATHGIGPALYPNLPYDADRDFIPVTQAASQVYALVVHPSVPARNVAELVALARRRPGAVTYASAGNGTAAHLFTELFRDQAGITLTHVPYRGAGPQVAATLAGEVSVTMDVVLTTLNHIRQGSLQALAVSGATRSAVLPEVPTLAEAGLPGYDAVGWNGVFVPTGTPPAVVARLADGIRAALDRPSVRERVEQQGAEIVASSSEEFARFVASELTRWRAVVARTGVRVE